MPDMDEGAFVLDYNMPVGTSLAQTDKVMRRVEAVLQSTPDISGYIRRTGAELGFFATEPYTGDILVSLKPAGAAPAGRTRLFDVLREELKAEVPELETEFVPLVQDQINDLAGVDQPHRGQGLRPRLRQAARAGREGRQDRREGRRRGRHERARLPRQPRHRDPARQRADGPGRPDRAGRRGSAQRRALRPGGQHGPGAGPDDQDPRPLPRPGAVRPRAPRPAADQPGDRDASRRGDEPGGDRRDRLRPARPARDDPHRPQPQRAHGGRTSSRSSRSPPSSRRRDLGSVNRELQEKLAELEVPARLPLGAGGELPGAARVVRQPADGPDRAAALVFLLLGFQFHSLTLPFLIFLAQPVSLASALFALWITGTPLNVSSFMGAILLIGLDVKNGIILIEYIGQLRAEGMPLHEALLKAGRTRFRPILMTSLCTILGLVPLAMGLGPGAQMQQPLAIAVIGGLITNMLLTRLLIPVGYLAFEKIRVWLSFWTHTGYTMLMDAFQASFRLSRLWADCLSLRGF